MNSLLSERLGQVGPWPAETYRFVQRMASARGATPTAWLASLRAGSVDFDALVASATVVHTSFFRHPEHFARLRAFLVGRADPKAPVAIWSAGCATGQEPYSIAMLCEELGVPARILATDVNPTCIERASAGFFDSRSTLGLRAHEGQPWAAPPALRGMIRFAVASLFDAPPLPGETFDVVFCRNVLFYLDDERTARVFQRFERMVRPDGGLVVAPVEALVRVPPCFVPDGPLGWLGHRDSVAREAFRTSEPPTGPMAAVPAAPANAPSLERVARWLRARDSERAESELRAYLAGRDDALGWFLLAEACLLRAEKVQARIAFERAAIATSVPDGYDLDSVRRAASRRALQLAPR